MNNINEKNNEWFELKVRINQMFYYVVLFISSIVVLVVAPFLGSTVGLVLNLPNTVAGWIVYCTTKTIVAVLNVVIFYCFMEQAKINVKDHEKYKEACEILHKEKQKQHKVISPDKWQKGQYLKKGVMIFFTTLLAAIGISQAVLSYDYVTLLTYVFTIVMGIVFGLLQMRNAEIYWTVDFYDYAKSISEEIKNDNFRRNTVSESGRTSTEE